MRHYAFCPVCGASYPPRASGEDPSLLRCQKCGFHFWQNSKPAVGALITRRREGRLQVLLSQRGVEPHRGMWDLPGGFLANGEAPEAGLARELREELNVALTRCRLVSVGIDEYPSEETAEEARFVLSLYYRCEIDQEDSLKPADDVADVRWFPVDSIPRAIAFPSNERVLRQFWMELGGGQERVDGSGRR